MTEYFDRIHNEAADSSLHLNPEARSENIMVPSVVAAEAASPNVGSYRIAGFWIRLWAFLLDLLVVAGLNAVLWNSWLPGSGYTSFIREFINVNSLFLGVTGAAYFILMTHYFQQTLGKMIFGIKVIQIDGRPLSWTTVIFRELIARSLSQLMGLYLGYVVCWFNAEKRCAHDFLSDTWVVYERTGASSGYITVGNN